MNAVLEQTTVIQMLSALTQMEVLTVPARLDIVETAKLVQVYVVLQTSCICVRNDLE